MGQPRGHRLAALRHARSSQLFVVLFLITAAGWFVGCPPPGKPGSLAAETRCVLQAFTSITNSMRTCAAATRRLTNVRIVPSESRGPAHSQVQLAKPYCARR
jgi:hypothetical protein